MPKLKALGTGVLMTGLIAGIVVSAFAKGSASLPQGVVNPATTTPTNPGVHLVPKSQAEKPKFKTLQGKIKSVSESSLTLTVRKTDYVVTPSDKVRIVNKTWKPITLNDIQTGDTVRVFGALTDTSVTAKVIRDVSLPRK
ncbi:MAG: hypothetical protein QXP82_03565 [Candidatus Aenigmatarchaeota archaeon]